MYTRQRSRNDAAVGLPISWYFDPEILEIERQRVVCRRADVRRPRCRSCTHDGDYCALGGQQAGKLLVRHNGRPQLVSNVCRHRQAQMLTGCGHAKNIVCPVHNWAYDLDGRQVAAPHFAENPCLDLERTELTEWNGLLFAGPRDVRRELAPLDGWTELSASDYVLERIDEEEHDLNWKAFLEVYLEDYHIGVVHPGFRAFVDPSDLRAALQAVGGERFFCEQVNVRWPLPPAGSPTVRRVSEDSHGRAGRPPAAVRRDLDVPVLRASSIEWYPFTVVVDDLHAALADAHSAAQRILLRPRDRRDAPRLCRDRPGRARRSHRRGPCRRRRRCKTAAAPSTTAATTGKAPINADGARPAAVPRLPARNRAELLIQRACATARGGGEGCRYFIRHCLPSNAC